MKVYEFICVQYTYWSRGRGQNADRSAGVVRSGRLKAGDGPLDLSALQRGVARPA